MITVNGKKIPFEEGLTVEDLLKRCRYTFPLIVVRVNGELVRKDAYRRFPIRDGDEIQAMHMMGGG